MQIKNDAGIPSHPVRMAIKQQHLLVKMWGQGTSYSAGGSVN
jgi:hypothetical protein